ncbi:F-ATPase gamma subunit [Slackia heliotrinireducens]|jgi:F-type H+-transporting ATPase subunit gamma|uniref:ATP synthase gamma chain n=1 Tax=Slackia heliotrinireducens (strain ATCC 29202 / DSM 20476 / NCTC 11029 / RHS 1) TaxID=471855 RepID=C7N8B6_SLAHD|nr:ATP synthase F1 subunit gamma [Slackia heliotrinireducens]ACV23151.1 ATP synthase, F1 gamma subunit [Slackia heliotrinireducens DSM 20476]VEH02198.1 F-ATPase gamma subunit [Slackia heliotrinireducens]
MPNLHDIDKRIKSVSSTKQITRTMEMVAGAKVKHANDRIAASEPYSNSMSEMLSGVAERVQPGENPLLSKHESTKRVLMVAVVSDRGLAGGFNSNILHCVEKAIRANSAQGIETDVVACGKKAGGFFRFRKITPVLEYKDLSADPTLEEANEIAEYAIKAYTEGSIDEVVLVYNHCKNAAEQTLVTETILPVDTTAAKEARAKAAKADVAATESDVPAGIEFEPEPADVLASLLPAYLRASIYHALIDSAAGEQAARRTAMHSATENATEMVETLSRLYNRIRQGAITTEISEIVGGAAALEE